MFGKIVFLASVAVAVALPKSPLHGQDPNTLSCDNDGHNYLLLPSFDDCTKFYKCSHGKEVEFTCSAGLWFDFELQGCNWPSLTECKLRTEGEDEIDTEDGSGDDSEWAHERAETSALLSAENTLNCADALSPRLAVYRDDCQRYWRCHNGIPETAFCSDGLYFNSNSLQCDFEANVSCARDAHEEIGEEFIRY